MEQLAKAVDIIGKNLQYDSENSCCRIWFDCSFPNVYNFLCSFYYWTIGGFWTEGIIILFLL